MSDNIQVKFPTNDFVLVELGSQNGILIKNRARQNLAERGNDTAATANENLAGLFSLNRMKIFRALLPESDENLPGRPNVS